MEIRFSETEDVRPPGVSFGDLVNDAAQDAGVRADVRRQRDRTVRFVLWRTANTRAQFDDATVEQHDRVIRALLTLDPDAVVRTAKAIYDGRDDFEAQVKARVP